MEWNQNFELTRNPNKVFESIPNIKANRSDDNQKIS